MTEQEQQKILTYFRNYNLNLEDRAGFKDDKKILLEVAEKTMKLLEYAGDELISETKTIHKMFEVQLEERINNQI